MLTVSEHVYDEATGIDHYVFEPGAMKAQVKVTETNGEPQVLLGVEGMAVQQSVSEPTWTVCMNKEIVERARRYRNGAPLVIVLGFRHSRGALPGPCNSRMLPVACR